MNREEEQISITVTNEDAGKRLDVFLTEQITDWTRSYAQNQIQLGSVTIGSQAAKANTKIKAGQNVLVVLLPVQGVALAAEDVPLEIVYQDTDFAVVNKPQGMVVHPAPGHASGTLVNALMYHIHDLAGIGGEMRPGIVHRIDKDTSGLLLVAKNDRAHQSLSAQIKSKEAGRVYLAITELSWKQDTLTVDQPIGRSRKDRKKMAVIPEGRPAVTHFTVLEQVNGYALVQCRLETGRTHQIRVHAAFVHHPVAGDPVYGSKANRLKLDGQALHAWKLHVRHPSDGREMEFCAPPPECFTRCWQKLGGKFFNMGSGLAYRHG